MDRAVNALQRLKGPVVPLNVCFNDDQTVDFEATGQYVDWLCAQKVPVVMLTYGSSEFAWMTERDIFELTARVGKVVAGRSLFIASTGFWPPRTSRDFLKHAAANGADAVKVQINMWEPFSGSLLRDFDRLTNPADLPMLLWYNPGPSRQALSPDALSAICELAKRPDIIGIKNDGDPFDDYYQLIRATAGQRFAVISGGLMRNFIFGHQVGSPAYLCGIAPFRPDISHHFYDLVQARQYDQAWQLVFRYEDPWLKQAAQLNWLPSIKTALYLHGLYPNNRVRSPRATHGSEQQQKIRQCLDRVFATTRSSA